MLCSAVTADFSVTCAPLDHRGPGPRELSGQLTSPPAHGVSPTGVFAGTSCSGVLMQQRCFQQQEGREGERRHAFPRRIPSSAPDIHPERWGAAGGSLALMSALGRKRTEAPSLSERSGGDRGDLPAVRTRRPSRPLGQQRRLGHGCRHDQCAPRRCRRLSRHRGVQVDAGRWPQLRDFTGSISGRGEAIARRVGRREECDRATRRRNGAPIGHGLQAEIWKWRDCARRAPQ